MNSLNFNGMLEAINHADYIAVDTETNGQNIRDGRGFAIGVSVAVRIPGVGVVSDYFPFRHGDSGDLERPLLLKLKETLESFKGVVYFHNAAFDLPSLRTLGIDYQGRFKDTMLMAHLINENFPFSKSLDACTKYYLKDEGKKKSAEFEGWTKHIGWEKVMPSSLMHEYAAYDADLTLRLGEYLEPLFVKEVPEDYWWNHKMPFVRLMDKIMSRGVRIDDTLCNRMILIGEEQMVEILDMLGYDNLGPKALEDLLINRLGLPVVKRSNKTGKPSFDKGAMEVYEQILERSEDHTAELILAYRGWQKSVSSNYRAYLELLSPDGRLRPNYKLHGTKTGRMSCEKPNLQQIPRVTNKDWNGGMKKAFIPEDDFTLWEADYSQLELRLGTAYAKEESLMQVFAQGRDIFSEMAEELGMPRQDVKTQTYTLQYGGGIKRLTEVFGISEIEARRRMDHYFNTYPGFKLVSNMAQRACKQKGKLKLWSGRHRHFMYPEDEAHKAFNSVIQGGAADIVEATMLRLENEVDNDAECRMLLQVHDSVVFEIKDGTEEYYLPKIKKVMEDIPQPFGVKFAIEIKKWGES